MNCTNHPDRPVASYCQNCGKALCPECVRPVSSSVYCEQCLAERLGQGPVVAGVTGNAVPVMPSAPNPVLAAVLGLIPGVGAMYNGQYVKAIVHVLVFVVLVGLTNHYGILGIFIAAWVIYQAFEAYHTARARRFGMPLPDPFGLNDLGNRVGLPNSQPYTQVYMPTFDPVTGLPLGGSAPTGAAGGNAAAGPAPGFVAGNEPAQAGAPPYGAYPPYAPVDAAGNPLPPSDLRRARREPIGAIVLIGLGMLFLFNSLGVFEFNWVGRGWPLILIGIGIWLIVQRTRGVPKPTGGR
ncbi:MAG: B-box zinc finger protein [Acidobacteriaceae bacterium]